MSDAERPKPEQGTAYQFFAGPLSGATVELPLGDNGYPPFSWPFPVVLRGPGGMEVRVTHFYFLKWDHLGRVQSDSRWFYLWGGPASLDEALSADHDWDAALEELG